jgi:hypothetical protein
LWPGGKRRRDLSVTLRKGRAAVVTACIVGALSWAHSAHARYLPKKCVDESGTVIPDSVVNNEVFRELGKRVTPPRLVPAPETVWPQPAAECRLPSDGVTVVLIVRKNGSPCGERVLDRLPKACKEFEGALLEGVRHLQFEPARVDGEALAIVHSVTLRFTR